MPVSVPTFIKQAWAAVGSKFTIPDNANPTTGRAGWDQGFSPINLTPVAAGGIPPFGQDMNGVLYDISSAIQYLQSGHNFPFDSDFASAIGGYSIGAIVSDASDNSLMWVNGTASNVAFPAGWTSFSIKDPTESLRGLPLVATQAENDAGTNDAKMVTPKKLRAGFSWSFSAGMSYIAFPSWLMGVIVFWGTASVTARTFSTITLPISMPSGSPPIVVGNWGSTSISGTQVGAIAFADSGPSSFKITATDSTGTFGCRFIGIGY